ncbi:MAG: GTP cyclohydrolase II [Candidatus Micrarchaeota archaeon]
MITKAAEASLPTQYGNFRVHAFVDKDGREHLALVRCEHKSHNGLPVRVHSKCLTGDTLTSLKCDCRAQLKASMKYIERNKCGILIYLDQEGRGIGLVNKIKAYALQEKGMDTVEANVHLGFQEDMRDFSIASDILECFGITEIALMTNNPEKIQQIEKHGIKVIKRIPIIIKANKHNKKYLETKKQKMKHML